MIPRPSYLFVFSPLLSTPYLSPLWEDGLIMSSPKSRVGHPDSYRSSYYRCLECKFSEDSVFLYYILFRGYVSSHEQ